MARRKPDGNLSLFKKEIPKMPERYYSGDKPNANLRANVGQHVRERPYDPADWRLQRARLRKTHRDHQAHGDLQHAYLLVEVAAAQKAKEVARPQTSEVSKTSEVSTGTLTLS